MFKNIFHFSNDFLTILFTSFRKMVKIFIGKLADATTAQDLRSLFEQCGTVDDAEKVVDKDIGFVRMPDEKEAFLAVG